MPLRSNVVGAEIDTCLLDIWRLSSSTVFEADSLPPTHPPFALSLSPSLSLFSFYFFHVLLSSSNFPISSQRKRQRSRKILPSWLSACRRLMNRFSASNRPDPSMTRPYRRLRLRTWKSWRVVRHCCMSSSARVSTWWRSSLHRIKNLLTYMIWIYQFGKLVRRRKRRSLIYLSKSAFLFVFREASLWTACGQTFQYILVVSWSRLYNYGKRTETQSIVHKNLVQ